MERMRIAHKTARDSIPWGFNAVGCVRPLNLSPPSPAQHSRNISFPPPFFCFVNCLSGCLLDMCYGIKRVDLGVAVCFDAGWHPCCPKGCEPFAAATGAVVEYATTPRVSLAQRLALFHRQVDSAKCRKLLLHRCWRRACVCSGVPCQKQMNTHSLTPLTPPTPPTPLTPPTHTRLETEWTIRSSASSFKHEHKVPILICAHISIHTHAYIRTNASVWEAAATSTTLAHKRNITNQHRQPHPRQLSAPIQTIQQASVNESIKASVRV